jgi:hypothetical protein
MVKFTTAPISDVAPKRLQRQPSQRSIIHQQYTAALRDALAEGQALVIELEPNDKALTIRNRLNRAAAALGREDVTVRRRGNRVVAYAADTAGA